MGFQIRQDLYDDRGWLDAEATTAYQAELLSLFEASDERTALETNGTTGAWVRRMLNYGLMYRGVSPAEMTADDLEQIVYTLIPRQVWCAPTDAGEALTELRAFWRFAWRRFGLRNAADCLRVLGPDAEVELRRALGDTSRFGPDKVARLLARRTRPAAEYGNLMA